MNKIGYITIDHYKTNKPKVCETPRHKDLAIEAYAVMAVEAPTMYNKPVVQMVCFDCWKYFDVEMGSPKWNLLGTKK